MQNVPLRKKYIIRIKTWHFHVYDIEFMQATAKETLEFQDVDQNRLVPYMIDFIERHKKLSDTYNGKSFLRRLYFGKEKKHHGDIVIAQNIQTIMTDIIYKRHKKHESIYKWIQKQPEKWEKIGRKWLFWSTLASICKEFNINGVNQLLDEYTMEQIEWMSDMLTFGAYEMTDNGRSANDKLFNNQWYTQEQQRIMDFYKDFW